MLLIAAYICEYILFIKASLFEKNEEKIYFIGKELVKEFRLLVSISFSYYLNPKNYMDYKINHNNEEDKYYKISKN